jgi:hypothetical protein
MEEEGSATSLSAPAYSLLSEEVVMETFRWLLPFTFGVDMRAIES